MGRRLSWAAALRGAAVLGVLVVLLGAGAWRLEGGRWFVVSSASMGEAAPVGSLLLTRPTTVTGTEVGDLVTFRNPDSGVVYSHRVVERSAAGLTTRGDVNAVPDAWAVGDADLVGEVVWQAQGLGWALRAVPLLLAGGVVVWVATRRLGAEHRATWRSLGASLTLAATSLHLRPWVGVTSLGQRPPEDGGPGAVVDLVSTGVLPIRVEQDGGAAAPGLSSGEVGSLLVTADQDGSYDLLTRLDLTPGWWAAVAAFCLLPLAWTLLTASAPAPAAGEPAGSP